MHASGIRFAAPVGATGCTKRQSHGCIGHDHRMHETNRGCIVLTTPGTRSWRERESNCYPQVGAAVGAKGERRAGQLSEWNVVVCPGSQSLGVQRLLELLQVGEVPDHFLRRKVVQQPQHPLEQQAVFATA